MDIFFQQIINGLVIGSVYALVALGYTMVYGILGIINFAHGEVVMIGAMIALSIILERYEQQVQEGRPIVVKTLGTPAGNGHKKRIADKPADPLQAQKPLDLHHSNLADGCEALG